MKPFLLLLLLAGNLQATTIYQCTSPSGRAIFSDQPCGADAQLRELSPSPLIQSDMGVSPARQKVLDQQLAQQLHQQRLDRIDNAISSIERQLDAAESEHDKALRDLVVRQGQAPKAKRTAYRLQRLALDKRYRDHSKRLKRELAALQKDRRQAERY